MVNEEPSEHQPHFTWTYQCDIQVSQTSHPGFVGYAHAAAERYPTTLRLSPVTSPELQW